MAGRFRLRGLERVELADQRLPTRHPSKRSHATANGIIFGTYSDRVLQDRARVARLWQYGNALPLAYPRTVQWPERDSQSFGRRFDPSRAHHFHRRASPISGPRMIRWSASHRAQLVVRDLRRLAHDFDHGCTSVILQYAMFIPWLVGLLKRNEAAAVAVSDRRTGRGSSQH